MSLVVAFAGKTKAIVGGDRRSIIFFNKVESLEEELYSGQIKTDEDLISRAEELNAKIQISDRREKVWRDGDVLVGEVTEYSLESQKRRRIYVIPGSYLLAEISGSQAVVTNKGKSALIVLGNRITRDLAYKRLGRLKFVDDSDIRSVFQEARKNTASVSQNCTVLSSEKTLANPETVLVQTLRQDCEENRWQISGLE
ncbi:MAG: MJ0548 connectase family domain-containing protein [Methanotrichaceae archaeon]